jgi:hypothetical protein
LQLWKKHRTQPRFARLPKEFETAVKNGGALVGSPGTPQPRGGGWRQLFHCAVLVRRLTQQEVLHSAAIFAREVMPAAQERTTRAV